MNRSNVDTVAHTAREELAEHAHAVAEDVKAVGRAAKSAGKELVEDTRAQVEDKAAALGDLVRQEPVKYLSIAAGVGFLVGCMFRR